MSNGTNRNEMDAASDYPLARSPATRMLADGLERLQASTGMTQRDVALKLNYRTSVVLSHMALGRVPIPIDRAVEFAKLLDIDQPTFLLATLEQRHPEVDFKGLFGIQLPHASAVTAELEAIAGVALDQLPNETKQILREVVESRQPERRWLSSTEFSLVEMLRGHFPALHREGLTPEERRQLITCLSAQAGSSQ